MEPRVSDRRSHVVLFVLGGLGVLLLVGFLLGTAYRESQAQAEILTRQALEILGGHIHASLRRLQSDLEEIAATVPPEAMELAAAPRFADALNKDLRLHSMHFPEVVGYRVFNAAGNLLYTSQPDMARVSAQGRSYFDELKSDPKKGLVFSEVTLGRATTRPLVFAAVPVRGKSDKFLGIVLAPIDLEHFQGLFDTVDLGPGSTIAWRRSDDGQTVLRQPAATDATGRGLRNDPVHRQIEAGEWEGVIRSTAQGDGIERIHAYRRIGDYPFYLLAGMADSAYLARWRATAGMAAAAMAGILLVLGTALRYLRRLEANQGLPAGGSRRSEAIQRPLLEAAPFPIVIAGIDDDRVKYLNRRAAQWLKAGPEELLGRSDRELYLEPESRDDMVSALREKGAVPDFEIEMRRHQDQRRWAIVSMALVEFDGRPSIFAAFSDISERRAAELATIDANERLSVQLEEVQRLQAALAEQGIRDRLTGLFNRHYLDETLERELARARREGKPLSLILLDIDHFKDFNETHGCQAGDLVLKAFADSLAAGVRAEDVACRCGGGEFLILLPKMPLKAALERANKWCRMVSEICVSLGSARLHVTASFGVSAYPDHAKTPSQLIQCAGQALQQAKHDGRNRVVVARALAAA